MGAVDPDVIGNSSYSAPGAFQDIKNLEGLFKPFQCKT